MIRKKEEFLQKIKDNNLRFWGINNCSMCGYDCGYIFTEDKIFYDSGCNCTGGGDIIERSIEDVAEAYNRNQRENNPNVSQEYLDEMDKFWGFGNENEDVEIIVAKDIFNFRLTPEQEDKYNKGKLKLVEYIGVGEDFYAIQSRQIMSKTKVLEKYGQDVFNKKNC